MSIHVPFLIVIENTASFRQEIGNMPLPLPPFFISLQFHYTFMVIRLRINIDGRNNVQKGMHTILTGDTVYRNRTCYMKDDEKWWYWWWRVTGLLVATSAMLPCQHLASNHLLKHLREPGIQWCVTLQVYWNVRALRATTKSELAPPNHPRRMRGSLDVCIIYTDN